MTSQDLGAAQVFRRLHTEGLLLLPNAWDAGSARLTESLGAKAIATTSAGVAWAHGYPDGDHLPVQLLAKTVREISRVVRVPLTVDVEGGYSNAPAAVSEAVAAVIDAGAVGINIEDGADTPDLLCRKIEHVKRTGVRLGVDLFVNARTDVYLRGLVAPPQRVAETLARAGLYRAAGADGLFVPGLVDAAEIRSITSEARLPLNVMAVPGLPPTSELRGLGVRRLSAGSSIAQAMFGKVAAMTAAFLRNGVPDPRAERESPMSYPELNALMTAP